MGRPDKSILVSMACRRAYTLFYPISGLVSWMELMAEPLMKADFSGS